MGEKLSPNQRAVLEHLARTNGLCTALQLGASAASLAGLERRRLVVARNPDFSRINTRAPSSYKITDAGRAVVAELMALKT